MRTLPTADDVLLSICSLQECLHGLVNLLEVRFAGPPAHNLPLLIYQ